MLYKDVSMRDGHENKTEKGIRLPVSGERLRRWEAMLKARNINQQQALLAMIDWMVDQDPMVQSMILRQQPARDDLAELVLERLRVQASEMHVPRPSKTGRRL
jgi:hypothetical protein